MDRQYRQHGLPLSMLRAASASALLLAALLLAACGGGSSRPTPPPSPPPTSPPLVPDPPPVVETPNPEYSRHLTWTSADAAHAQGLTGAGIRIGVIDSGVMRNHPALRGRVVANLTYVSGNDNNLAVDDVVRHGTAVAQTIAGAAFGRWPGGIAPGAEILSARIIRDTPPEDDGSGRGNEISGALGMEPIHRDLIQRGMRIMNNSWGGLYWNNLNATALIAAEYRDFIMNRDGLVVFSTGNSGFDNPSDTAALPSKPGSGNTLPAADLERGWLAVAALSEDDPTLLADYSNACGVAMFYCLAAPGTVVVTGHDDAPDAPSYWRWNGTSFSAPIVSGAAALVWEAFPYFNNNLVRQTLLGTATDLGEPGVDAVFGYGALDIARAVKGPAQLDWGDIEINFNTLTSVFGNDLSGEGALVKAGNGTLVLQGRADNLGGLFVDEGTVQALQTVAGDVDIAAPGRLVLGDGRRGGDIGGTLDNSGRVDILAYGNEVSTTRIGGDYWHEDSATLALELGQRVQIAGRAMLNGGAFHLLGVKSGYTTSAREEVLHADGGVNGSFARLTAANSLFLEGTLAYGEQQVWLDITRLNVAANALNLNGVTPMALSGAVRIEQAFAAIERDMAEGRAPDAAFSQAAGQFQRISDANTAVAALDSLSGQAHAQALTLAFDSIDLNRRGIASRLSAVDGAHATGTWRQALGQGGDGGIIADGWSQHGWMIGRDLALGNGHTIAGLSFGESQAETRQRGHSRARQTQGQFYLGQVSERGYLAAQFGFARVQQQMERHLLAGNDRQGVFSQSGGDYHSLGLEAGGRLALGAARLTPYLGLAWDVMRHDPFQEWGGSGFGLRADAAHMQRRQAIAGLRAEGGWRGLNLRAHAQWQEVLAADGFALMASFTGTDSWSPLPLAAAARSGGVFGVGVEAQVSSRGHLSASFDQRFGARGAARAAMLHYVHGF